MFAYYLRIRRENFSCYYVFASSLIALCFVLSLETAKAQTTHAVEVPASLPVEFREIYTKNIFGFAEGADIGAEGEKEIEFETNGRFNRRQGRYRVVEQEIEYEAVPTQFFSYTVALHGVYHDIKGVDGITNIDRATFSAVSAKFRYILIGKGPNQPFGLTFLVEPEWSRIDGGSGVRTRAYGATFRLAADAEIISNRLYGALNVFYGLETSKEAGEEAASLSSSLGVIAALAYRITPQITIGGAVEYNRAYDGLTLRSVVGQALYVGPTLYVQLSKKTYVSAAFAVQVAGRAAGENFNLDLTNFERYRGRLRVGFEF